MTEFFIIYAFIFLLIFLALDTGLFLLRKKYYNVVIRFPFASLLKDWITVFRSHFSKFIQTFTKQKTHTDNPIATQHMPDSTNNRLSDGKPSNNPEARNVHVEFSADIPAGSVLHVTIKAQSGNGLSKFETQYDTRLDTPASEGAKRIIHKFFKKPVFNWGDLQKKSFKI